MTLDNAKNPHLPQNAVIGSVILPTKIKLGNTFLFNNKIVKIEAITNDICSVSGYENNRYTPIKFNDLKPIKIQKDYLKNKGFIWNNSKTELHLTGFPIAFFKHPRESEFEDFVCFFFERSLGHIKFTYQFENFFSSFSGSELTDR